MVKVAKKLFTMSVVTMTILWSVGFAALIPTVAMAEECPVLEAGDLFKVPGNSAVYLLNADMERMYFPNGEVYHTWYADYSGVQEIPNTCVDAYPAPSEAPYGVNYRPGSRLVKVTISPSVYLVEAGNQRTKIGSEEVAAALYGADWASLVRDVADVYWPNFASEGTELAEAALTNGMLVTVDGTTVYQVVDGMLYEVDGDVDGVQTVSADLLATLSIADTTVTAAEVMADPSQLGSTPSETGDDSGDEEAATGELSVSLSANTPDAQTIAKGSTNVDVLKFNVKAGSEAVTLDELTVKRSGIGATTGLTAYVYDGDMRIGSGKTFSSDDNEANFSVLNIEIAANTTKELTLRLKSTGSSSGEHVFSVTTIDAGDASVSGLPVAGNKFTFGSESAGTLTVEKNGTLSNPTIGDTNVTLTKFKLTAATEDAMLYSFTLKQDGTIDTALLSNYKLAQGTTDIPVDVTVNGRYVTFSLQTPFKLVDGSGKIFTVTGDVSADTDVSKTIIFYMQYNTDVKAVGESYGFGVLPTITDYDESGDAHTLTVAGGGLTISNLSASAHDVKTDTTSVVLGKVAMKASSDTMEVQKMVVTLATTKATSGGDDYGTYRDTADNGGYDSADDTLLIRNIKLRDADTGKTLGSAKAITDATGWVTSNDVDTTLTFTWTDYFSVKKGETRNIELVADINSAQISSVVYLATFDFTSSNFTVKDSSDNTVSDIVPASTVASHNVTTRTSSLTVSRASSPESRTVVKGSTVDALGMIWTAGSGEGNDVKVSSVVLDTYVNASSSDATYTLNTETESVATNANMLVTNVSLYVGDTLIAGPVGVDSNGRANFTSSKFVGGYYTVPAGTSKSVVVKADVSGNAPYGSVDDQFAFTLDADDITAEDDNGSVTPTVSGTNLNGTTSPTVEITVTSAGTITTAADSGKPDATIVLAGLSTEQEVHRVLLTATKETWNVNKMTLQVNESGSYDDVEYVQLYDTAGTQLGPDGGIGLDSNGKATFTGLDIDVSKTGNTVVVVKAKLKAIDERTTATSSIAGVDADSGDSLTLKLSTTDGDFNAVGSASGSTDTQADAAVGNTMVVRKSKPTVTIETLPSATLAAGERVLMKIKVVAPTNGDIVVGSLSPYITFSDSDGATSYLTMSSGTLYAYDITGSETQLNTTGANAAASSSAQFDIDFDSSKVVTVPAGGYKTFEIRATFTGVETGDSVETKLVRDGSALSDTNGTETFTSAIADSNDDFIWSDKGADTNGYASNEWINGYLLNLPTTSSVLSK